MNPRTLKELENAVIDWAREKGIFSHATPKDQMRKTDEEVTELYKAVMEENKDEIKDGIGDTVVTLIIQAHMQGYNLSSALQYVMYDNDTPLVGRTGRMVDGIFVKDE